MSELVAGYFNGDGRAFHGPPIMHISRHGRDLATAEIPEASPGIRDYDAALAELGYRRADGAIWWHSALAGQVPVEPIG